MTETRVKRFNILWHQDTGNMKAVNLTTLPVLGVAKRTLIKLRTWTKRIDFAIVKIDDFDIVLEMDFLLKHKVIPMPLAKCLIVTRSNPTIIKTNNRQPGEVKMRSALQLIKDLSHDDLTLSDIIVFEDESSSEPTQHKPHGQCRNIATWKKKSNKVFISTWVNKSWDRFYIRGEITCNRWTSYDYVRASWILQAAKWLANSQVHWIHKDGF